MSTSRVCVCETGALAQAGNRQRRRGRQGSCLARSDPGGGISLSLPLLRSGAGCPRASPARYLLSTPLSRGGYRPLAVCLHTIRGACQGHSPRAGALGSGSRARSVMGMAGTHLVPMGGDLVAKGVPSPCSGPFQGAPTGALPTPPKVTCGKNSGGWVELPVPGCTHGSAASSPLHPLGTGLWRGREPDHPDTRRGEVGWTGTKK